jgi:hypothetical protein
MSLIRQFGHVGAITTRASVADAELRLWPGGCHWHWLACRPVPLHALAWRSPTRLAAACPALPHVRHAWGVGRCAARRAVPRPGCHYVAVVALAPPFDPPTASSLWTYATAHRHHVNSLALDTASMGCRPALLAQLADAGVFRLGLATPLQSTWSQSFTVHQSHHVLVATINQAAPS